MPVSPATSRQRPTPGLPRLPRWAIVSFAVPLLLYVATLAPTVYNLDSAEFTTAAYTGGLVRATGYPLYLLVGRAWSRLPVGDPGYRMNLLSAVCGALTLALAARLLRRLGVGGWAAFGALGLLATSRFFWGLSLIAEVYTPHTFLMAGVLLLLVQWGERPTAGRLGLATLAVGLAAAHHMATVLFAPGCLWYVLRTAPRQALRPAALAAAAAGLVAGLSLYLYLPWVAAGGPAFSYVGRYDATGTFRPHDLTTAAGLWWLVSGRAFAAQMGAYDLPGLVRETGHFLAELWRSFVAVGLGPGVVGAAVLWRRRRVLGEALLLMFAGCAGFYVAYAVGDKDTMFLPAYLLWALWLGVGYQWLLDWVRRQPATPYLASERTGVWVLRSVMVGAVLFALTWNGPLVDLSGDNSARLRGELALEVAAPGALVVGWWNTVPVIEYLQLVEGRRPDLQPLNRFLISLPDLRRLVADSVDRRPVYFDEPAGDDFPGFGSDRLGPLYRLRRTPLPPRPDGDGLEAGPPLRGRGR